MIGKLIHWGIIFVILSLQIKLDEKSNLNEKKVKDKEKHTINTLDICQNGTPKNIIVQF